MCCQMPRKMQEMFLTENLRQKDMQARKEGKKKKLATAFICITKENKNLPSIPSWESKTFSPRLILKVSSGERKRNKYE